MLGTEFSLIQELYFPNKTRHQIQLKYKKEERQHPSLLRMLYVTVQKVLPSNYSFNYCLLLLSSRLYGSLFKQSRYEEITSMTSLTYHAWQIYKFRMVNFIALHLLFDVAKSYSEANLYSFLVDYSSLIELVKVKLASPNSDASDFKTAEEVVDLTTGTNVCTFGLIHFVF